MTKWADFKRIKQEVSIEDVLVRCGVAGVNASEVR